MFSLKKKVFIDASSAILLYKSNLFTPLLNAWQLVMSPEVFREITETGAFVLLDDGRAARFCHTQQIPFINALLVPKIFWYSGFMDQQQHLKKTAQLCKLGRYSKTIMEMAGQFSSEELTYFIEGDCHER